MRPRSAHRSGSRGTSRRRGPHPDQRREALVEELRPVLEPIGGTAGLLLADVPAAAPSWPGVDAVLFSLDNDMT